MEIDDSVLWSRAQAGDCDAFGALFESYDASNNWGRSLLAVTESCAAQASDTKRARDMAFTAVRLEP